MVWQVLTKGIENEDREQQSTKMKKKKKIWRGTMGSLAFQSSADVWNEVAPFNSADYAMEHLQQLLDKAKGSAGRMLKFSVFYRNQHPDYFDFVRYVLLVYSRLLR